MCAFWTLIIHAFQSGKQFRSAPKKVTLVEPVVSPVTLSSEQKRVLQAVLQGHNIFFTGSAGTGKSFLLRRIIGEELDGLMQKKT